MTPRTAKSQSDLDLRDLLFDGHLFGIFRRRNDVRHVDDGRDAPADGGCRAGGEVFFVRQARIAEMHVRVDEAGENVLPFDVDHLRAIGQRVACADGDDLATRNRHASLEGLLRRDHVPVLDDQIRFHFVLPLLRCDRVEPRSVFLISVGVEHPLDLACVARFRSASENRMRAFQACRLSPATKPRFFRPGLRTTRPPPMRLHRHISSPCSL